MKKIIYFFSMMIVTSVSQATLVATGPDAFGYHGANADFDFRDVSNTGTFVELDDDEMSSSISVGFDFNFYGNSYNEILISSNGWLTFDTTQSDDGCCNGEPLPVDDGINNVIAGWWGDLSPEFGDDTITGIYYDTLGSAGSREFIVGFYDVVHCCSDSSGLNTFEMILHETSNEIEFQYNSVTFRNDDISVGIENSNGTVGLQALFIEDDTTSLNSGDVVLQNTGYCIGIGTLDCASTTVPEPTSIALLGLGLAGFGFSRKKKKV